MLTVHEHELESRHICTESERWAAGQITETRALLSQMLCMVKLEYESSAKWLACLTTMCNVKLFEFQCFAMGYVNNN